MIRRTCSGDLPGGRGTEASFDLPSNDKKRGGEPADPIRGVVAGDVVSPVRFIENCGEPVEPGMSTTPYRTQKRGRR